MQGNGFPSLLVSSWFLYHVHEAVPSAAGRPGDAVSIAVGGSKVLFVACPEQQVPTSLPHYLRICVSNCCSMGAPHGFLGFPGRNNV